MIELFNELYIQETKDENGEIIKISHEDGSIILHYSNTDKGVIDSKAYTYKPSNLVLDGNRLSALSVLEELKNLKWLSLKKNDMSKILAP